METSCAQMKVIWEKFDASFAIITSDNLNEFIPTAVMKGAKLCGVQAKEHEASMQLMLEARSGDLKKNKDDVVAFKKMLRSGTGGWDCRSQKLNH